MISGVAFAVVNHDHLEARNHRDLVQVVGNVSGAKDVEQSRRKNGLDEDFQRSTANQASVVLGVVVKVERQGARLFLFHDFARRLPDLGFHAAAADGAGNGAVIADEHLRRLERRNRAADRGDGRYRAASAFAAELDDLFVDVHARMQRLAIIDADGCGWRAADARKWLPNV